MDYSPGWNKNGDTWVYVDKCYGKTEITADTSKGVALQIKGWMFTSNTLKEVANALLELDKAVYGE